MHRNDDNDAMQLVAVLRASFRREYQAEQFSDAAVGFDRMPQRQIRIYSVAISTTVSFPFDVATGFEIRHDPLNRPLVDPDSLRNVAESNLRVLSQQQ